MQRYQDLLELRKQVNGLYEEIKILQIFVSETVEDIPLTITEKISDIDYIVDNCLLIHTKLNKEVLLPTKNSRKKIIDFNDIKINLEAISTCLYFLKIAINNNHKELVYIEIENLLKIMLKKSENVINLANKTKLKIYQNEKSKTKSSVKNLDFSKYEILPNNIIRLK